MITHPLASLFLVYKCFDHPHLEPLHCNPMNHEIRYMHYKEVQRSLREKDEAFVDAYSVDGKVSDVQERKKEKKIKIETGTGSIV